MAPAERDKRARGESLRPGLREPEEEGLFDEATKDGALEREVSAGRAGVSSLSATSEERWALTRGEPVSLLARGEVAR